MAIKTDYIITARFLVSTPDDPNMTPDDRYQYVLDEFHDIMGNAPANVYLLNVTDVDDE